MPGTKGGLWTYRRLVDHDQFELGLSAATCRCSTGPATTTGNRSIIDRPANAVAAALQDAKRVSLGFLYWLQTEAPAEGDRLGASELKLRADLMGTADGLAKFPYIRESRRIKALRTVVEQDVSAHFQAGPTPRISMIRSAWAGIPSTFIALVRKTSASVAAHARSKFLLAHWCPFGCAT